MSPEIKVIEKPDWVSWDVIHKVLWNAHEKNRSRGMNMAHAAFSGEQIEDYLAPDGSERCKPIGQLSGMALTTWVIPAWIAA